MEKDFLVGFRFSLNRLKMIFFKDAYFLLVQFFGISFVRIVEKEFMRLFFLIVVSLVFCLSSVFAQDDEAILDTNAYHTDLKPIKIFRPNSAYSRELKRVQKLYPYALYAASVLDSLNEQLAGMDKKRQERKTSRQTQKQLFDEFNFMIKDLYRSEGRLLMKLINRETGMTVAEIISKYRGKLQSTVYSTVAKMFDQDLNIKYDPTGKDKLTERVIQDIKNEAVYFDPTYKKVTKQDYKDGMVIYRADKKKSRQNHREKEKNARKRKKLMKKEKKAGEKAAKLKSKH